MIPEARDLRAIARMRRTDTTVPFKPPLDKDTLSLCTKKAGSASFQYYSKFKLKQQLLTDTG